MNTVKAFIKTYLGTLLLSYIYLILIHKQFESSEINTLIFIILFANMPACIIYFIGVLWPFHFLFKSRIAALSLKEAIHKYMIYFTLIPLVLLSICLVISTESSKSAMQFSLLLIDATALIYLGFLHTLKYRTQL